MWYNKVKYFVMLVVWILSKNIDCSEEIRSQLNQEQENAVTAPIGNVCINAIAGSGKTRVLTYRVANLIENGYNESDMILLTFTNKAAQEMTSRIRSILNKDKLRLLSGTFHSVACQFLRKYAGYLDLDENFSILSGYTQKRLMDNCREDIIKSYEKNPKQFPSSAILVEMYSGAINHDIPFVEYIRKNYTEITETQIDEIIVIFQDFINRKKREGLLDFDDLLISFYDLLHNYPEIRKEIADKFKYIFVDEYQDINQIQFDILQLLNVHNSMFVIGDTAQCIYQFRGSKDEYIEQFGTHYPDANIFDLTYNYRSDGHILKLAEEIINKNEYDRYVECNTVNELGLYPTLLKAKDEVAEAELVAKTIKEDKMFGYQDIAIIVRKGTQCSLIYQALNKYGIPYNSGGEIVLYEQQHMKDLFALVSVNANYKNESETIHALSMFQDMDDDSAKDGYLLLKDNKFDIEQAMSVANEPIRSALANLKRIKEYKYRSISQLIQFILDLALAKHIRMCYSGADDKIADIKDLINTTTTIKSVKAFMDIVSLSRNSQTKKKKGNVPSVTVMTMHKSKGLEWDEVFIPFVSKGEFPKCTKREYNHNEKNVKDERNLLYVGVTRARYKLYISYSDFYGKRRAGASDFLTEISNEHLQLE